MAAFVAKMAAKAGSGSNGAVFFKARSLQQAAKAGSGEELKEMEQMLARLERKLAEREAVQASRTKPAAYNETPKPEPERHSKEVVRNKWAELFH